MNVAKELSLKNPWYIPKYRYLELRNYCLQYPEWVTAGNDILSAYSGHSIAQPKSESNTVLRIVEDRMALAGRYFDQMRLVKKCVKKASDTSELLERMIFDGVTKNISYDAQVARDADCAIVPRNTYYDCYRRFFYILDQTKKEAPYVRS